MFKKLLSASKILCLLMLILPISSTSVLAQNEIVIENQKPGNPPSEWDIDPYIYEGRIMGFATDLSVNKGQTVNFKIRTDALSYKMDIYRIGYYQGNGARKVGTATITNATPKIQPLNLFDTTLGLIDCSNWLTSANWKVPSNAVSGVYIAKITRHDNAATNHIIFIVRDDASTSDLYFKTSDATWQAYNDFGEFGTFSGNLYYGRNAAGRNVTRFPNGRSVKVSYDRPYQNRSADGLKNFFFSAEYAMVRWLERNGYSVSYFTDVDAERNGSLIKNHQAFLSVGHDEYWSVNERNNVEAARDAGVHLAFFSGNEVYWKTRWEPAKNGIANRVLVCYKEGNLGDAACGAKCDPLPNVWTGLWRNGCEVANGGACKPESILSGQISYKLVNASIKVPAKVRDYRFWRNSSIENLNSGEIATLSFGTLGYEMDYEQPNYKYPEGRVRMSETTIDGSTHKLSLFRHESGALVFGAGTVQWSWGLDGTHDLAQDPSAPRTLADPRIQQATVNILADMDVQPSTLQSGLVKATLTTDRQAPLSVITSLRCDDVIAVGEPVNLSGISLEYPGVIAGVELSFDDGDTWVEIAAGSTWNYTWTPPAAGQYTIKCRAFDDMGNIEKFFWFLNTIEIKAVVRTPITLTIPTAKAYSKGVDENTVYLGYEPASDITLNAQAGGGVPSYKYLWSNGSSNSSITVSPNTNTTYTVTVTDQLGTIKTASRTVYVKAVSCGSNNRDVQICTGSTTSCIKDYNVATKLSQGSFLGSCSETTVGSIMATRGLMENSTDAPAPVLKAGEVTGLVVNSSPNPTNSYFTIEIKSNDAREQISLKVIAITGKVVEARNVKTLQTIYLGQNYPSGVYLLEVLQGKKRVIIKLLKQ